LPAPCSKGAAVQTVEGDAAAVDLAREAKKRWGAGR
jgi:hypothetical protein